MVQHQLLSVLLLLSLILTPLAPAHAALPSRGPTTESGVLAGSGMVGPAPLTRWLSPAPAAVDGVPTILITASGFYPDYLEVTAGDQVRWENRTGMTVQLTGGTPHRIYLPVIQHAGSRRLPEAWANPSVQSRAPADGVTATITAGGVYTHTFDSPGEYPYFMANWPRFDGIVVVAQPLFDFAVELDPTAATATQGDSRVFSVEVTRLAGAAELVDLAVGGLPPGTTYAIHPGQLTPDRSGDLALAGSARLTITTTLATPVGDYTVAVTGTAASVQRTGSAVLTINPHPDFTLTAAPAARQVTQGEVVTYAVSVGTLHGFADPVDLQVSGLPAGADVQWSADPVTPPGQSVLTVQTALATPTGNYTLTISGVGGGFAHQATAGLRVTPHPDFYLLAAPSFRAVLAGEQTSYTVTLTALHGFADPVSLSLTGLPEGTSVGWETNPALPGVSVRMAVSTTAATPTGSYPLVIHGVGGGFGHAITVTLNVGSPPDLVLENLSVSPLPADRGSAITITARVVNQGAGDAGPFRVSWQAYGDWQSPLTPVYSGVWELAGLPARESAPLTATVVAGEAGFLWLDLLADAEGQVVELDESNNALVGEIGVRGVVSVCGSLNQDVTWAYAVYVVTCDVTVQNPATLTVRNGAVIKFQLGRSLRVQGALESNGTPANPIVFTSIKDDDYGGDTNNDGATSAPARGDWRALWVDPGGRADLAHTLLRYGGAHGSWPYYSADLWASGGLVSLHQVTLEQSHGHGLWVSPGSTVTATQTTAQLNSQHGVYLQGGALSLTEGRATANNFHGLHLDGGNAVITALLADANAQDGVNVSRAGLTLQTSSIRQNGRYGIYTLDVAPIISATDVLSNTADAVYLEYAGATLDVTGIQNLTAAGNAIDELVVAGTLGGSSVLTTTVAQVYVLNGLTVPAGADLWLPAGVVLKMKNGQAIRISGNLHASGAHAQPVVITSLRDDTVGGDTNNDGATSAAARGDWSVLWVDPGGRADLTHTLLRYGGAYGSWPYYSADLWASGGLVSLHQVTLEQSHGHGLWVSPGSTVTATQTTAQLNSQHGVYLQGGALSLTEGWLISNAGSGVLAAGGASATMMTTTLTGNDTGFRFEGATLPTLRYNSLTGNASWGVYNTTALDIDAAWNWWGDPSGPTHASNPGGSGDKVSDRVVFSPWLALQP